MRKLITLGNGFSEPVKNENVAGIVLDAVFTHGTANEAIDFSQALNEIELNLHVEQAGQKVVMIQGDVHQFMLAWAPTTLARLIARDMTLITSRTAPGVGVKESVSVSLFLPFGMDFGNVLNLKGDEELWVEIQNITSTALETVTLDVSTRPGVGLQMGIPVVERMEFATNGQYKRSFTGGVRRLVLCVPGTAVSALSVGSYVNSRIVRFTGDKFEGDVERSHIRADFGRNYPLIPAAGFGVELFNSKLAHKEVTVDFDVTGGPTLLVCKQAVLREVSERSLEKANRFGLVNRADLVRQNV